MIEHEFSFTESDFRRISTLIYRRAGISLGERKRELVYSRLARLVRGRRLSSFAEYLDLLSDGDSEEWEMFTNALTTNLTSFFREPHHFPILAQRVREAAAEGRSISLWSCAASSGEEPYSVAMTAVEALGSFNAPVKVLATDIDTAVLRRGEDGIYAAERVEKMEPGRLRTFFLQGVGKNAGLVRVKRELRRLVIFRSLNLLADRWPVTTRFDAIFCRNVMIYFDKETQYRILERFVPLLQPGGLLFAGHSESFTHAASLFRPVGKTVYALPQQILPIILSFVLRTVAPWPPPFSAGVEPLCKKEER